eukprot:Gb_12088 [translate_table: standard]
MAITDYSILPVHDSKSQPPQLFDGTTRLYISVKCPYAQRVWITRNCKGLQDIQILPIDLQDRPDWYKEKVYPPNKVPSLEHNGKVTGESLDLLRYLNNNFEGPELNPTDFLRLVTNYKYACAHMGSTVHFTGGLMLCGNRVLNAFDPAKKEAADELLKHSDSFPKVGFAALSKPESEVGQEVGPALDYLENALGKFDDGPFFLGQFSLVDIAYAPFVDRYQIVFPRLKNYDITAGRPKLSKWIEASDKCLFLCTLCCYR